MPTENRLFINFRLPAHCVLCNMLHRGRYAVCDVCMHELPLLEKTCITCTTRLPEGNFIRCRPCQIKKPLLDYILCAHRYSPALRHLLHAFKYREALYLAPCLAALMQRALPMHYTTECLIPIPMYKTQLKQRGFNQTQLLAAALARAIKRPINAVCCKKTRETSHQAKLSARTRQHNLTQAFEVAHIPYQHVTLVDDLMTTGATANELVRTLRQQGVKRVDLWCCAKAGVDLDHWHNAAPHSLHYAESIAADTSQ